MEDYIDLDTWNNLIQDIIGNSNDSSEYFKQNAVSKKISYRQICDKYNIKTNIIDNIMDMLEKSGYIRY